MVTVFIWSTTTEQKVGTEGCLTVVQVVVLVPQAVLKRWAGVEGLSEVGRCPWAEQREREWRW